MTDTFHGEVRLETDATAWDAFVSAHPSSTAYHTWAWREVFGGVFGHEPLYLGAHDASGLVGVLPVVGFRSRLFGRFLCSLPFVNYGGMLIGPQSTVHGPRSTVDGPRSTVHGLRDSGHGPRSTVDGQQSTGDGPQATVHGLRSTGDGPQATVHGLQSTGDGLQSTDYEPQSTVHSPQSTDCGPPADRQPRTEDRGLIAAALMERAATLARERGAAHVELRHIDRQLDSAPVRTHKVTMWLRLAADVDAQWKALDNKVRNQVRKAEKSQLTAVTGGAELLPDFYPVFAETMRDLGTPVYPRRFFRAVMAACGAAARIHIVRLDGRPVAASITIDHAGRTEVPWAASLRAHRQLCPNMLLYWHMLRDTISRGVPVFDFGRSTPGEGTFHFKKQWKAEPIPLHWEYALTGRDALPDQSPTNAKFHLAIEAWKRLPLALANRLGPLVIGNIP